MADERPPAGPGRFYVPAPGDPGHSGAPGVTPSPAPSPAPGPAPRPARQPGRPAGPPPRGPGAPAGRPRRRRRWLRWTAIVLVPLLLVAGWLGFRAWSAYRAIERVDLAGVLDPVSGPQVNYLLVGSDSREGLDPDVGPGGRSTVTGKRSDTIILLRVGPDGSSMMSIPRDLWVTYPVSGRKGRVNGAYNAGPEALVRTVKSNLNVPVNHYMEVGFDSFAGLVDALGGVTIDFPHPASDRKSGLRVDASGPVTLDGRQALAYVRSRTYTETIDGKQVTDPTADLGREKRQQTFLRTALGDVGATRNPLTLVGVAESMSSGLTIDSTLGAMDLFSLGRRLGATAPATVELPTRPATIGGAAVLLLKEPDAQQVLAGFR
ncbi:MAG: LCP family protein [Microthrixaceae bacterium]